MFPKRIVCLTEETTETLYLLGEGDRVVGISGYTVRPPEARQKPKVSSFLHARYEKIEALEAGPDPRVLRSAGRHHQRPRQARLPGVHLQPAQRRRDPADDPRARAASSACRRRARRSSPRSSAASTTIRAAARDAAAPPEGVFRGVGRPADQRHPLDRGAGRDRRRRADLPGAAPTPAWRRTASSPASR